MGILSFAIGVGIMVLVHEWGHFIVARLFGVRVEVFSIGFGPRIWGMRRGTTDYRLSALPLGGYVRMAGDNPAEERRGDPDEFLSKPRWQRVLIALAGPAMNVLMAVVLMAALFMHGGQQFTYSDKPIVVGGVAKDSLAQKAGVQPGDRVVEFGRLKNPTWGRVDLELALSPPGHTVPVTVQRKDQTVDLTVDGGQQTVFSVLGYPAEPIVVGNITQVTAPDGTTTTPAKAAGLQHGDMILPGGSLSTPYQLSAVLQQNAGKPLDLQISRAGHIQTIQVRPSWGDPGDGVVRWSLGMDYRFEMSERRDSAGSALVRATQFQVIFADKLVYLVGQLFTGRASLKQVQGPLGIVQVSSEAAKEGFGDVVGLMAMVSLNLGIINLLPIPILDGGHIAMLGIESVLRHDLSLKFKERIVTVGMVFLLLVFIVVMYNDVLRLFAPGR